MANEVEFIPVRCPHCGAMMGRMTPRGPRIVLLSDGWEITEGARECPDCRKRFAFRPKPLLEWNAVVERYLKVNGRVLDDIMRV